MILLMAQQLLVLKWGETEQNMRKKLRPEGYERKDR
jgi:hypothetical protein